MQFEFPFFEKIASSQPVKSKRTPNQLKKVKYTTKSSKDIMLNLKEQFSLQKRCNETNESDENNQESNQEEEYKEICLLFNEEVCED